LVCHDARDERGRVTLPACAHDIGPRAFRSTSHIGSVTICTSGLEVGDPLAGTNFTDTVGGFTYHPQELAFFSWFYRQSPSLGVHGWYSDQGTFRTPSTDCN